MTQSLRWCALERPWACRSKHGRGDEEGGRVHREDRTRAREAVDPTRDRRADHERSLARDTDQRVRRTEARLLDEQREDAAERRLEQAAAETVQRDKGDHRT